MVWKLRAINLIKSLFWNNSLHRHPKINTSMFYFQFSAYCVRHCLAMSYPQGCEALSQSSTFEVHLMALGNDPTHAIMLNTFAWDVLNSLRTKRCTCNVHQLRICFIWQLLLFRSIVHSTLHSSKCRIMLYLAELCTAFCHGQYSFNFDTCLTCFFTSIRFICWMHQPNDAWQTPLGLWKLHDAIGQCFSTFFASRTTLCNKKIWGNAEQNFIITIMMFSFVLALLIY